MAINEAGSFRAAVAIVNADESSGRRSEDLALVFQGGIRLNNGDWEVAGGVRLQVHVPQKSVAAPQAQTPLQRPETRSQHASLLFRPLDLRKWFKNLRRRSQIHDNALIPRNQIYIYIYVCVCIYDMYTQRIYILEIDYRLKCIWELRKKKMKGALGIRPGGVDRGLAKVSEINRVGRWLKNSETRW